MDRPWWARRGPWRPGKVNYALLSIQAVAIVQASIRGLDYVRLHRPESAPPSPSLRGLEQAGSLTIWAALFLVPAAVIVLGELAGRAGLIVAGHLVLFGTYVVVGVSTAATVTDNIRSGAGLIAAGLIHGIFCIGIAVIAFRQRERRARGLDEA